MDLVRREQTPIDFDPLQGRHRERRRRGRIGVSPALSRPPDRPSGSTRGTSTQITGQPNRLPLEVDGHARAQGGRARPALQLHDQGLPAHPAAPLLRESAPMSLDVLSAREARDGGRKRERGVALIMVLGAIAVMIVMLAEFQDDASSEFAAATAARDSVQAEYSRSSAINLSRLLIAAEPTMRQAIAPLFMLMKQTPPQLPGLAVRGSNPGRFQRQGGVARTLRACRGSICRGGEESWPQGGSLRGRHRRRGREDQRQHGRVERDRAPPPRQAVDGPRWRPSSTTRSFLAARLDRKLQRSPFHLLGHHRLGGLRRAALLVRPRLRRRRRTPSRTAGTSS